MAAWWVGTPIAQIELYVGLDRGRLWFDSPEDGSLCSIPITTGPASKPPAHLAWHAEVELDRVVVSPSIHYPGHFHSPNPVTFTLGPRRARKDGAA